MAMQPITIERAREIIEAVNVGGSISEGARTLGLPRQTLTSQLSTAKRLYGLEPSVKLPPGLQAIPAPEETEKFKQDGGDSSLFIDSVSERICTVEQALEYGKVDTSIWTVDRFTLNSDEVAMKMHPGMEGNKRPADKATTRHVWRIKIWLKRIAPKPITDALDLIYERTRKAAPKKWSLPKLRKISDPHMLELDLMDVHFGKLAWAPEAGHNYDLRIAEEVYLNAVNDLLAYASQFPIEKIVMPLGNDFGHIDNEASATTAGTRVDSDGRYAKVYAACIMALHKAIDRAITVAPIEIPWIPGNHDWLFSYHLCRELSAHYHNNPRVTVDTGPASRKRCRYGVNLIGFTHGNEESPAQLRGIMPNEWKQDWSETTVHEWHIGHTHRSKKVDMLSVDESDGIVIRTIRSLSATDAWHYRKGYIGAARAAEAYIWSKHRGYAGHFNAYARHKESA